MNLNITPWHFEALLKQSFSLDIIYILKMIESKIDLTALSSKKIKTLLTTAYRKGLITEDKDSLTTLGTDLLLFLNKEEGVKFDRKVNTNKDFDLWWKAFPGTNTFVFRGVKFTGCRTLKANKEKCKEKFNSIVLEGEYTATTLTAALEYDVAQKRAQSLKSKSNKLTYMQNSMTYLNQRSYEPYIELINSKIEIEETHNIGGGTDI